MTQGLFDYRAHADDDDAVAAAVQRISESCTTRELKLKYKSKYIQRETEIERNKSE